MKDLLKEIFGNALTEYTKDYPSLPIYLKDNRAFYLVKLFDKRFVLIQLTNTERFHLSSLKKQINKYLEYYKMPVVYGFDLLTSFQRKTLVENKIAFISNNKQVFLPFIGVFFDRCVSSFTAIKEQTFTPAVQLLFLLLLYTPDNMTINRSQAATKLGISPMSITRGSKILKQLGIIEEKNSGTEIMMHRIISKKEAYKIVKPYLINPIQKELFILDEFASKDTIPSGEYALSFRSDLLEPKIKTFAINKKVLSSLNNQIIDPNLVDNNNIIGLQVWKYDYTLFIINQKIDPVSLICSFNYESDERIHKCLTEVEKEIDQWEIV